MRKLRRSRRRLKKMMRRIGIEFWLQDAWLVDGCRWITRQELVEAGL